MVTRLFVVVGSRCGSGKLSNVRRLSTCPCPVDESVKCVLSRLYSRRYSISCGSFVSVSNEYRALYVNSPSMPVLAVTSIIRSKASSKDMLEQLAVGRVSGQVAWGVVTWDGRKGGGERP